MKIQDIRRSNLSRWVEKNGVPQKEKSYFSQLLGGASFGERSARRLERQYRMGDDYLDGSADSSSKTLKSVKQEQELSALEVPIDSDEYIELLLLYQSATSKGRQFILKSARVADKGIPAKWIKSDNES